MRLPPIALLSLALTTTQLEAQIGRLDASFNPDDLGFAIGEGPDGWVEAGVIQGDGKIILAGSFTTFNGALTSSVVRLNADGTLDAGFAPQQAGYIRVYTVALQLDGKILLGGEFNTYAGTPCSGLVRLNTDGSFDNTFHLGTPWPQFDYSLISTIAMEPDGKILIGGAFSTYDGVALPGIARLEQDGTLDPMFDPGSGVGLQGGGVGRVNAIHLHADGRIDIGGFFSTYDDQPRGGVARLHADGTLDASFNPGGGAGAVTAIAALPDGGMMVGGMFTTFHGTAHGGIVRLEADGTVSSTFSAGSGIAHSEYPRIRSMVGRSDGTLLIGGLFDRVDGQRRSNLALLGTDGSLSPLFDGSQGTGYEVLSLVAMPDGGTLALGMLGSAAGVGRRGFAAYHNDGTLITDPGTSSTGPNGSIQSIGIGTDGTIMIAGWFGAYNGSRSRGIARITSSGIVDGTFDAFDAMDLYPSKVAVQPDGKTLVLGSTLVHGRSKLKRLNVDGTADQHFPIWSALTSPNSPTYSTVVVQPDGKILIAGWFQEDGSNTSYALARLNNDGSLDESFALTATYAYIPSIALQADGKILVGGSIETWGGPANNLIRLNTDGTRDTSFDPGTALLSDFGNGVQQVAVRADGRILVGGDFNSAHGIQCLMPNGALDPAFFIGTGFSTSSNFYSLSINSVLPQTTGTTIVTGSFDAFNGTPVNGIVRLNADGSLDNIFDAGTGPDSRILCAALQPDGDVLIGGDFHSYDGIGRNHLARVRSDDDTGLPDGTSSSTGLSVHPNPASSALTINSTQTALAQGVLNIYNAQGQVVHTAAMAAGANPHQVSISHLANGAYSAELQCGDQKQTARFTKHD